MDPRTGIPPLLGDGEGRYRVHIVGNSGTGKSTVGAELAAILGVPFIALDTLYWLPGWKETPVEEFRIKVRAALDANPRGWVVDGNYIKPLGPVVPNEATDTIWVDPPLLLYFPRLCLRTLGRLLGLTPSCSPGCPESISNVFFSRESIIWWCLSNHWPQRKRETELLRVDGVHVGGRRRRIGGWGSELEEWKQSVRDMMMRDSTNN